MRQGVFLCEDRKRVTVTFWGQGAKQCKLCLYKKGKIWAKIPMFSMKEEGAEDLFCVELQGDCVIDALQEVAYCFEMDQVVQNDPYMKATSGRDVFGKKTTLKGRFAFDSFDWSGENRQRISYQDMILYQCHLRGYTKHASSRVSAPGTYLGFCEKLDYLRDLGINSILFQPLYDFNERMEEDEKKINYWGYTTDACYFAPKASYAFNPAKAVVECKTMIKKIHQKGMNIFMDMHFGKQSPEFILRCLRYYAVEYHVDGFLVDSTQISPEWLQKDPVLSHCKFLGNYWEIQGKAKNFARFNDEFLNVSRRFLKSDEGQVYDFYQAFKADSCQLGAIHYITQKNGFTLRDLVSYDVKHNESNGEKNQDGTEYNYSWNCGQEGVSRKKVVNAMRLQQTKNAFCMLLLGLATPMILGGDEFGRTQKGNNNAYCQDNATTWVDWSLFEKNQEIFDYVKQLLAFRKNHALYHRCSEMTGMDRKGLGAPDVSGHGREPWEMDTSYYSRELGVLYYGAYYEGKSLYMMFNFHWDAHDFYLPKVDEGEWKIVFDTGKSRQDKKRTSQYQISPRSIVIFELEAKKKAPGKIPDANVN